MNPVETQATVAVLAAYLQGKKDGMVAGVAFSAITMLVWKAYKRERTSVKDRLFVTHKV